MRLVLERGHENSNTSFSSLFAGTCGETARCNWRIGYDLSLSVPSLQGHVVKQGIRGTGGNSHLSLSVPSLQGHVVKPQTNALMTGTILLLSVPSLQGHVVKLGFSMTLGFSITFFQFPLCRDMW